MNSNQKGKRGERELAKQLNALFGVECRRGQQYAGTAGDADVIGLPGVHLECKREERLSVYEAMEQAVSDAKGSDVPLVCWRRNGEEWLAIVRLSDLPRLRDALSTKEKSDR